MSNYMLFEVFLHTNLRLFSQILSGLLPMYFNDLNVITVITKCMVCLEFQSCLAMFIMKNTIPTLIFHNVAS